MKQKHVDLLREVRLWGVQVVLPICQLVSNKKLVDEMRIQRGAQVKTINEQLNELLQRAQRNNCNRYN